MAFSVNTNIGAMAALQSLSVTQKDMATTQSRINTGLNVNSTKDDSAAYTIAQTLRGDVGGLKAVSSSLNRAKSTVDVAVAGAEQISDLLNQMKSKATEAADAGLDDDSRTQVVADLTSLKSTIDSVIKSTDFNGTNLLDSTGSGSVAALTTHKDLTATLAVSNQGFDTIVAGLDTSTITNATTAGTFKGLVDTAFDSVKSALSTLGSASRKIDAQLSFNSKLSDAIDGGIGNLVDADLAKESANLQALQVKQQLGVQALSIANQAPQSIMSLFR
ncbi:MAG: flagellin [Sphingomonas bacterium]